MWRSLAAHPGNFNPQNGKGPAFLQGLEKELPGRMSACSRVDKSGSFADKWLHHFCHWSRCVLQPISIELAECFGLLGDNVLLSLEE
jgi:hypothetical protein